MNKFWKKQKPTNRVVEVVRLEAEQYKALVKRLPNTACPSTPEEYAYRLGVQHALTLLRDGFVYDH